MAMAPQIGPPGLQTAIEPGLGSDGLMLSLPLALGLCHIVSIADSPPVLRVSGDEDRTRLLGPE